MPQSQGSACGLPGLKASVLLFTLLLVGYIVGPPLYWRFVATLKDSASNSSCLPCPSCDCSEIISSVGGPDCRKLDSSMQDELAKNAVDLLTEELKLQEHVFEESQRRSDIALLEAKKLGSQYQKEAEKCNAGMDTCEAAREKAEEDLRAQKKMRTLWEQRARDLGWKDE